MNINTTHSLLIVICCFIFCFFSTQNWKTFEKAKFSTSLKVWLFQVKKKSFQALLAHIPGLWWFSWGIKDSKAKSFLVLCGAARHWQANCFVSFRIIAMHRTLPIFWAMSLNFQLAHLSRSKFEISLLGRLPITPQHQPCIVRNTITAKIVKCHQDNNCFCS